MRDEGERLQRGHLGLANEVTKKNALSCVGLMITGSELAGPTTTANTSINNGHLDGAVPSDSLHVNVFC